jgi:phosphonate transport system permease protein
MTIAASDQRLPPAPARRRPGVTAALVTGGILVVHVMALRDTDFSLQTLIQGWHGVVDFLQQALPPDLSWLLIIRPGLHAALVTLYIGLLGTTLSVPLAVVLAFLGSRAITPGPWVYQASRSLMSALRSIPEVVYALIFVTAVGLGPFAGVLALVVHNTGVMGKLWSEAMDEVDRGPMNALQTNGATGIQVVLHAVVPAVVPQFIGLLLYRFDVNVRASLVLGLVGAGGIGFLIDQAVNLFRFDQMVTYIIMVLILIIAVDQLSAAVRRRIAG